MKYRLETLIAAVTLIAIALAVFVSMNSPDNAMDDLIERGVLLIRRSADIDEIRTAEIFLHANPDGSVQINGRRFAAGDVGAEFMELHKRLIELAVEPMVFVDSDYNLPNGAISTNALARKLGLFSRVHLHGGRTYSERKLRYQDENLLYE